MDRSDFFYRQKVTEAELDAAFDYCEAADKAIITDLGFYGLFAGLTAAQHSPNNLTVDVLGGTARTPLGERVYVPSTQVVDVSKDWQNVTTAVNLVGNTKIVSVFLKASRNLQNPRTDGNGNNVYYDRLESFRWFVTQGAEAVSPVAPPLEADGLLIADVVLAHNQTQVINANLSIARRQDLVVLTGSPFNGSYGSIIAALQAIVTRYDNMVSGTGDQLSGTSLSYLGSTPNTFANGTTLAASTYEVAIDTLVLRIGSISGTAGDAVLGVLVDNGGAVALPAGTLQQRLQLLRNGTTIVYGGSGTWADATSVAAGSMESAADGIVSALGGSSGSAKVGWAGQGNLTSGAVQGALQQLTFTGSGNDGAKRIGTQANGNLTGATVRIQLDELDTDKGGLALNNLWQGQNDFDGISVTAGIQYGMSSRSVTRMLGSLPAPSTPSPGASSATSIALPHGAVLTAVTLNIVPGVHGAWPPATKSGLSILSWNGITASVGVLGSVTDPASNLGQGNANRPITISGLSITIDRTVNPFIVLQFNNETGANATTTTIASVAVTATIDRHEEMYVF